jgi:hypothetical protein
MGLKLTAMTVAFALDHAVVLAGAAALVLMFINENTKRVRFYEWASSLEPSEFTFEVLHAAKKARRRG